MQFSYARHPQATEPQVKSYVSSLFALLLAASPSFKHCLLYLLLSLRLPLTFLFLFGFVTFLLAIAACSNCGVFIA
ncbi:hypothetical protein V8E51_014549 [Hyaloscypha variabilis]